MYLHHAVTSAVSRAIGRRLLATSSGWGGEAERRGSDGIEKRVR